MSSELIQIPSEGEAELGSLLSTCITTSSSASEVIEFLRMSSWLMDLSVDQKILTDRENALKAEIENLKKAKESVQEFEKWKMRVKREMEELKEAAGKKEVVEERLEASEKRSVLLERRVAHMEENNGSYVTVRLAAQNGGLATFGAQNHLGPKKEASDLNLKPQKWMDENEMRLAFVNDTQFCMNAICALYKNLISAPLLANDKFGVVLATYLINGYPENKLNMVMSEISKDFADESIWLALKYSAQLFRIYSSGEDPFFSYNSTM